MSERIKLQLKKPIQLGEKTITELAIREPKAGDYRRLAGKSTMADGLQLLGIVAGQPTQVIDELSVPDMLAGLRVVEDFSGGGPETGSED